MFCKKKKYIHAKYIYSYWDANIYNLKYFSSSSWLTFYRNRFNLIYLTYILLTVFYFFNFDIFFAQVTFSNVHLSNFHLNWLCHIKWLNCIQILIFFRTYQLYIVLYLNEQKSDLKRNILKDSLEMHDMSERKSRVRYHEVGSC